EITAGASPVFRVRALRAGSLAASMLSRWRRSM
ncbi:MAG: hypothetical protein, partial [Olavius algarvensis spirochete endosymbiont]